MKCLLSYVLLVISVLDFQLREASLTFLIRPVSDDEFIFIYFLKFYLAESTIWGDGGRGGDAGSSLSRELDAGLDPRNLGS